jgi:hypothetical protein
VPNQRFPETDVRQRIRFSFGDDHISDEIRCALQLSFCHDTPARRNEESRKASRKTGSPSTSFENRTSARANRRLIVATEQSQAAATSASSHP